MALVSIVTAGNQQEMTFLNSDKDGLKWKHKGISSMELMLKTKDIHLRRSVNAYVILMMMMMMMHSRGKNLNFPLLNVTILLVG